MSRRLDLTFLGTGTSQGAPVIGASYPPEFLANPKNHRTRSSIHVASDTTSIVVDTTPEFRIQALREGLSKLDAVLITHPHADHIMGMDDLRRFCDYETGEPLPIYGSEFTLEMVKRSFWYAFHAGDVPKGYFKPIDKIIEGPIQIGDIDVEPLPVPHGKITSTGYLFSIDGQKRIAYLTDCHDVPDPIVDRIHGVDTLAIDALRPAPHPTHLCLDEALRVVRQVGARVSHLTHLAHDYDHDRDQAELPPSVHLAYDGLKVSTDPSQA